MNYDGFFGFCEERHKIYLKRAAGEPWPWTDDPILRQFSFTNVYRELDKTTAWFRENVRNTFCAPDREGFAGAIWSTVLFRWFNRIEIGVLLNDGGFFYPNIWDARVARNAIRTRYPMGPWATGAYIIKTPVGKDKLSGIIDCADGVHRSLPQIVDWFQERQKSLEEATRYFTIFDHLGWFMSYEIVTDLRHTPVLSGASDIYTWANPGPGAERGAARVLGKDHRTGLLRTKTIEVMQDLLAYSEKVNLPKMEMRDIEHCLCEFDKYERTRLKTGRPRNVFTPPHKR